MKKTLTRVFAIGFVVAMSFNASAIDLVEGSTVIGLHMASVHDVGHFNNNNPGLYLEYKGVTIGSYTNSYKKESNYLGYTFNLDTPSFPVVKQLSLTTGVISGYSKFDGGKGYMFFAIPSAVMPITNSVAARLSVVPNIKGVNEATCIHFSIETRF